MEALILAALAPDVLYGILLPVVIGTLCWGLAFPFWRRERFYLLLLLIPIGTIAPLLLAVVGLRGVPPTPPVDADGWMFPFAELGLFLAIYGTSCVTLEPSEKATSNNAPSSAVTGSASVLILSMILAGIGVYPLFHNEALTLRQAEWNFIAISFAAAVMITCLTRSAKFSGRAGVWHFFATAISVSVLLVFSASAYLGLLTASLAAALGPAAVLTLVRKNIFMPEAVGLALAFLMAAAMAQGFLYAYMPLDSALLVAVSPGFLALGSDGKGRVTRFFGTICFLALALLLAGHRYLS